MDFVAINDDCSLCSYCTSNSFGTVCIEPFSSLFASGDFGAGMCELLSSSSLLILAGSGASSSFSPRKLRIVNTKRCKVICELSFSSTVDRIEAVGRTLLVASDGDIFVHDIASMKLEYTLSEKGKKLRLLSSTAKGAMLAYIDTTCDANCIKIHSLHGKSLVREIEAHKTNIRVAKFSADGSLLATASEKASPLAYNRGHCPDSKYIGVSSSSGTGHVFRIEDENASDTTSRFTILHGGSRDFARFHAKGKPRILAAIPKPYRAPFTLNNH